MHEAVGVRHPRPRNPGGTTSSSAVHTNPADAGLDDEVSECFRV